MIWPKLNWTELNTLKQWFIFHYSLLIRKSVHWIYFLQKGSCFSSPHIHKGQPVQTKWQHQRPCISYSTLTIDTKWQICVRCDDHENVLKIWHSILNVLSNKAWISIGLTAESFDMFSNAVCCNEDIQKSSDTHGDKNANIYVCKIHSSLLQKHYY